jgi:nucleoside-diphosphate-sugar epimerase
MTIAITGATGFVGRHAVDLFARQGRAMRLLIRKESDRPVDTVIGSLEDQSSLKRLVAGASAVVHIAGAIAARSRDEFFAVNKDGTARLARAAAEAGIKTFVHVSSIAAREPQLSDYGASKRAGEEVLHGHGFDPTILRPPVIYGPGDRTSLPLLDQLTHRVAILPGSPKSRFSLIYAEDVAAAIAHAVDNGGEGIHEIDDGAENGYSWPELVAIAARIEGHDITPVYLPQSLLVAAAVPVAALSRLLGATPFLSADKVRQLYYRDWVCRRGKFGFTPKMRFAEGFAATVRWYREQGWLRGPARADKTGSATDKGVFLS